MVERLNVPFIYTLSVLLRLNANWKLECKLVTWILVSPMWSRNKGNKLSALTTGAKFISEVNDYLILSKKSASWFRFNTVYTIRR